MATSKIVLEKTLERRSKITELVSLGHSNKDISEMLGVTPATVRNDLWRMGLKCSWETNKPLEVSKEFEQVVLGSILGDGHLKGDFKKGHNIVLSFAHSLAQQEYFDFKKEILSKHISCRVRTSTIYSDRYLKGFIQECRLTTGASSYFTELKKEFYPFGKKIVTDRINALDSLGVAIWYLDDGYKTGNSYRIATNSFPKESLVILQNLLLNKFNIETTVHKGNQLYIPAKYRDAFTLIVRNAIPKNLMEYKLHTSPE